jgi:hypothetical protein
VRRIVDALSLLLALGQLGFALGWVLISAAPVLPGRISWIAGIDQWWALPFGLAGVVLLIAVVLHHGQHFGHALCAGTCAAFALGGWVGVLGSVPPTNPTTALAMTLLSGTHVLVSMMYRGGG